MKRKTKTVKSKPRKGKISLSIKEKKMHTCKRNLSRKPFKREKKVQRRHTKFAKQWSKQTEKSKQETQVREPEIMYRNPEKDLRTQEQGEGGG